MTNTDRAYERLAKFMTFKEGWERDDSPAPTQENYEKAKQFLSVWPSYAKPPHAMIDPETGYLGFFWNTDKVFADAEFNSDWTMTIYLALRPYYGAADKNSRMYESVPLEEITEAWLKENAYELLDD